METRPDFESQRELALITKQITPGPALRRKDLQLFHRCLLAEIPCANDVDSSEIRRGFEKAIIQFVSTVDNVSARSERLKYICDHIKAVLGDYVGAFVIDDADRVSVASAAKLALGSVEKMKPYWPIVDAASIGRGFGRSL